MEKPLRLFLLAWLRGKLDIVYHRYDPKTGFWYVTFKRKTE